MIFDALEKRTYQADYGALNGSGLPDFVKVLRVGEGGWLRVQPISESGEYYDEPFWLSPSAVIALRPFFVPAQEAEAPR